MEINDVAAWLVLAALYLFGGAAFFDTQHEGFTRTLIGWAILNGLFVAVALIVFVVLWAAEQVVF